MSFRKIKIRTLLLRLSVGGIIISSIVLLSALMLFQKGNIENSLLDGNIAYASKLADTTDLYLDIAQKELEWSASLIHNLNDLENLRHEVDRLRLQSGFFNSVIVVNPQAVVKATSPESLKLVGIKLNSRGSVQALEAKKTFISEPYIGASGNYVVFISSPVFSDNKDYIGYVGGTIYLKKQSILSRILSNHFYSDDTDVSIVSADGNIVFNKNPDLVGTNISLPVDIRNKLRETQKGSFRIDKNNKEYLVGFANIKKAGWSVLISGSSETVSNILRSMVIDSAWFILLIIIIAGISVALVSARISQPLEMLSVLTRLEDNLAALKKIQEINAWYQEADRLKKSIHNNMSQTTNHVAMLSNEAKTDPLTGLYNRRGFDAAIKDHLEDNKHCVILLDIDHFKKINDVYGHDAGDTVLCHAADIIKSSCRDFDIVGRMGGEEFIVFLPNSSLDEACKIAERIRLAIYEFVFPLAGKITISGGVTSLNECENDYDKMLKQADIALYEAKGVGRNVMIASHMGKLTRVET
ncbi:sensor domain-containing diguanylate cyclase [Kosakonia sp. ML.JS2a]|uniref:sensor domain-containing diguanylate cyclase n=1 Tax=Kosakonia sp. ML.JS2a TaxID=2980557 RepID=UPI0021DA7B00|nr:sensor domain-containing diguanylate cyclase [Kosakonia sp. ML.JS2a]UXY11579.1 sensor domain-containing diguanylate cyclase [Kosakonia sp. ML.JS2a]